MVEQAKTCVWCDQEFYVPQGVVETHILPHGLYEGYADRIHFSCAALPNSFLQEKGAQAVADAKGAREVLEKQIQFRAKSVSFVVGILAGWLGASRFSKLPFKMAGAGGGFALATLLAYFPIRYGIYFWREGHYSDQTIEHCRRISERLSASHQRAIDAIDRAMGTVSV